MFISLKSFPALFLLKNCLFVFLIVGSPLKRGVFPKHIFFCPAASFPLVFRPLINTAVASNLFLSLCGQYFFHCGWPPQKLFPFLSLRSSAPPAESRQLILFYPAKTVRSCWPVSQGPPKDDSLLPLFSALFVSLAYSPTEFFLLGFLQSFYPLAP